VVDDSPRTWRRHRLDGTTRRRVAAVAALRDGREGLRGAAICPLRRL